MNDQETTVLQQSEKPMTEAEQRRERANASSKKWRETHRDKYEAARPEYEKRARDNERQRQQVIQQLERREAYLYRLLMTAYDVLAAANRRTKA